MSEGLISLHKIKNPYLHYEFEEDMFPIYRVHLESDEAYLSSLAASSKKTTRVTEAVFKK